MKKMFAMILAVLMILSCFAGCGAKAGSDMAAIKKAGKEEMDEAVKFADESPYPDPSEVTDDMYTADNERCVAR